MSDTSTVAFVTDMEQVEENFQRSDEQNIPVFEIRQIRRRKYARLEIDWISTSGWKEFVRPDRVRDDAAGDEVQPEEPTAQLSESAVEEVNEIMDNYRDRKMPNDMVAAPMTRHGAGFISYPPMLPEDSRELAADLEPIVMDQDNWEPSGGGGSDWIPYEEYVAED